jgi:heme exporter protein A
VRGERLVFEDVSFSVAGGEALVLRGANGSGKSTLLRLIAGLLRRSEGTLIWRGTDTTDDPEAWHADLCFVGHLDAVKPLFTVAENLAFWSGIRGEGDRGPMPALAQFGLADLADVPARFLSAGQKRRLGLARLLAVPVPVWLLDEPTVSLDADSVAALAAAMAEHRAAGGLVIAATHAELGLDAAKVLTLGARESV